MASSWKYRSADGAENGPFDESRMKQLVVEGALKADTQVWSDKQGEWRRLSDSDLAVLFMHLLGAERRRRECRICSRIFQPDELVEIEGLRCCAECKPVLIRRLQEGSAIPGYLVYGGFWVRALAKILDWIIIGVVQIPFSVAYVIALSYFPDSFISLFIMLIYFILSITMGVLFNIFFLTKFSATPGKMAFGLGLINADGTEAISWKKATGRYFAEMLGGMIMYIGYVIVVFDNEKRALHDYMCGTRVVYKR